MQNNNEQFPKLLEIVNSETILKLEYYDEKQLIKCCVKFIRFIILLTDHKVFVKKRTRPFLGVT